ncbi:MAG: signal peptidase II [Lachnospiraceae bacterium]|nr:signal peptidase II [Lachnospiraceae bacterium]
MSTGKNWKAALLFALAVLLDQVTKIIAVKALEKGSIPIIPGVLQLTCVENRGAAFGIMQNATLFFTIVALAAVELLVYLYLRTPSTRRFLPMRLCFILIAAGAAGNLIDRIMLHYVRDFIYFCLIDFPVFNVADIYVTVCTFGLAFLFIFYYKDEELSFLFPDKKAGAK